MRAFSVLPCASRGGYGRGGSVGGRDRRGRGRSGGGQAALGGLAQGGQELLAVQLVLHGDPVHAGDEVVVGDDGVDRDQQAGGGRHQRGGDALGDDLEPAGSG